MESEGDTEIDILNFVFPPTEKHSHSTALLYIYVKYGPFCRKTVGGKVKLGIGGGKKHSVLVSPPEMRALIQQEEEEFLLEHEKSSRELASMTGEERMFVLSQANKYIRAEGLQYTKDEVEDLLELTTEKRLKNTNDEEKKDQNEYVDFHEFQQIVLSDRMNRIKELQNTVPKLDVIRQQKKSTKKKEVHVETLKMKKSLWRPLADGTQSGPGAIHRLLSRKSHSITVLGDQGSESTQNVRLVRDDDPDKEGLEGWKKF